ncbi:DUF1385 domain-containing protein [archaeon]|jgi:uncharacterized protein YqhQ|nr:DUF1385 domain-containing protein [archaeon]MBT4648094.1 DUF1385 domain-containing protein [archaeon]MBT6822532.1 DUF1385 domain-containing protein [archaeon]MBT7392533.1 DUF1385 domain-containing protein [archaeon]
MSGKTIVVGGQAVIEGVMMRSPKKYAISVRGPDGKITTKIEKIKNNESFWHKTPILRGIFKFAETLVVGVKAINYSANAAVEEDEQLSNKELVGTIIGSFAINIVLFIIAPLLVTNLLADKSNTVLFNIVDGIIRLVFFVIFLLLISLMKDIKRLFQYHGAEHMAVNCYEQKKKLTVENVKKCSRLHPRCGTTFLLIVMCLSILIFSVIPTINLFVRFLSRLVLIPIVAGISYEILKFTAAHVENPLIKLIIFPGLSLQRLTTRIPDGSQIEVSIDALKKSLS